MITRILNWKKQKPDANDYRMHHLAQVRRLATVLPAVGNNRKWCSAVKDQGQQGCCTGHAWASELEYDENKFGFWMKYRDLSRAFIYWNERVIEGTTDQDSGAELRDGAKAVATYGVALEGDFPYNDTVYTLQPSPAVFKSALKNVIHSYYSLDGTTPAQTLTNLKTCIASGQCFVFGFQVYDSFMTDAMANSGIMPMPDTKTESVQGGHAVFGVGYNDHEQRFLIKNSWGTGWGLKGTNAGYFTMPYAFISDPNMASDFWTVVKEV